MRGFALTLSKTAALWLVLMIAQIAGGMLIYRDSPPFEDSGPFGGGQVLLLTNAVNAVILAALSVSMRLRGAKLGLTLGVVFFALECGLSAIEVIVFGADLHMTPADVVNFVAFDLFHSVLAGAAIALLWRGEARKEAQELTGLAWKVPAIVVLYIVCYSVAGYEIAWRSEAVRAHYVHLQENAGFGLLLTMLVVQCGRGLIWCGLALLLARNTAASAWRTALLTGLAFALVMTLPLLAPNQSMPWPVRAAHFVEIVSSNVVFGIVAVLILLGATRRTA